MRTSILGVLSGALVAACGGGVGEDLDGCRESTLSDFNLPEELDGLELRAACLVGEHRGATSQRLYGESCADSTCAAEVAMADELATGGTSSSPGPAGVCGHYVAAMRDGQLVGTASNGKELVELVGPIDTLAEAQLVAELQQLGCIRSGADDGSFLVVGKEQIADCPIVTREVLYRIRQDGSVSAEEYGEEEESNACVGRRPAGLRPRGARVAMSRLADYLARSAELEAASVVAFQILEAELAAHGAPQRLLDRARAAAADEIEHAQLMQELAARFGAEVSPRSVRVRGVRDLESVALENVVEGCVTETWGCLLGMHQARRARGSALRRAYRRIAADEARHAQLSWDVADWAERKLGSRGARRVRERRAEAVAKLALQVTRESEPRAIREVLGLPDAPTRIRLFAELNAQLWS